MALEPLHEQPVRTAIHRFKPEQVATILERRPTANVSTEFGNDFNQPSPFSAQVAEGGLQRPAGHGARRNAITGFRRTDLSHQLPRASTNQVSRCIKRLRVHEIIKRVERRYKYYTTELGRRVVMTGLKLQDFFVIPHLNALPGPI